MDSRNVLVRALGIFLIVIDLPVGDAVYSCSSYFPNYRREFCYSGQTCCSSYHYRYCCDYYLGAGTIAGIIIGSLIGVACLIVLLICCCKAMNKNRGNAGRVVYPNGGGNVSIVNTTQNTTGGYSQPSYPVYPSAPAYPPGSGPAYQPGSGPAYPPGSGPAYPTGSGPGYSMAGPSEYPPPPPQYSQSDPAPYPTKY